MNLNIETLNKLTEQHYKLLLEADPNEKLISKYLNRSFCFEATYNNELLGVLILLLKLESTKTSRSCVSFGFSQPKLDF